jgi:hypothetical protein
MSGKATLAYPVASGRHQPLWCWLRQRPIYPVLLKQPDKQKLANRTRSIQCLHFPVSTAVTGHL